MVKTESFAGQEIGHGLRRAAVVRKNVAFAEWGMRLVLGDRLPRGRYFAHKRAERSPVVIDSLKRQLSKFPFQRVDFKD